MSEEVNELLLRVLPFILVMVGLVIAFRARKINAIDLYLQPPYSERKFMLWCGLFLLFKVLSEVLIYSLGLQQSEVWNDNGSSHTLIKLGGFIILAPIAEELIFRGLFLHVLRKWGVYINLAILIQAAIFVALHSFAYEGTLASQVGIAQTFIMAVLYAYAMYSTRSIYTPIVMHVLANMVAVAGQFLVK